MQIDTATLLLKQQENMVTAENNYNFNDINLSFLNVNFSRFSLHDLVLNDFIREKYICKYILYLWKIRINSLTAMVPI